MVATGAFNFQGITSGWRATQDWVDDEGNLSLPRLAARFSAANVSVSSVALCVSLPGLKPIYAIFQHACSFRFCQRSAATHILLSTQ
jgi:hypothetical protein